jgi:hypothetical protein
MGLTVRKEVVYQYYLSTTQPLLRLKARNIAVSQKSVSYVNPSPTDQTGAVGNLVYNTNKQLSTKG